MRWNDMVVAGHDPANTRLIDPESGCSRQSLYESRPECGYEYVTAQG